MITPGLEDYLEFIYNRIKEHKNVKAIDIANAFNISRPSVSEALIRLADLDLIIYEGRKGLKITSKGIKEAKKVVNKHKILFVFFITDYSVISVKVKETTNSLKEEKTLS